MALAKKRSSSQTGAGSPADPSLSPPQDLGAILASASLGNPLRSPGSTSLTPRHQNPPNQPLTLQPAPPSNASNGSPPPASDSPSVQLARNLILARHALAVTQEGLAHRSGISRATIAQIESGDSDCRLSTLSDIAAALGISPALLLLRPGDVTSLLQFVRQASVDRVLTRLPLRDIDHMNRLRQSGLQKDLIRAAHKGVNAAEQAGFRSSGAAVGAGIGSAFLPGLGTAVGTLLGAALDAGRSLSENAALEDGAGI